MRRGTRGSWALLAGLLALSGCDRCNPDGPAQASAEDATSTVRDAAPDGAPEVPGTPTAELVRAVGDVRWQRAATASWVAAGAGLELRPADAVQTMAAALAGVRFRSNGASVVLGPSTTLRIPDQPPAASRLRHLSGRLTVRLAEGSEPGRLEVELPPGTLVLEAEGGADEGRRQAAEANVEVTPDRTEVAVVRGGATLDRRGAAPIRVEEAHFVELTGSGEVVAEGRTDLPVELLEPVDGSAVRTRGHVSFAWSGPETAEAFVLQLEAEGRPPIRARVPGHRRSTSTEVPSGEYLWTVRAVANGAEGRVPLPRSLTVEVDRTPPALELRSPAAGAAITGPTVTVEGRTEPGASLTVDGRPVAVGADGRFSMAHPVARGLTNVVVRAADDLGNARAVSRSVLRE